MRIIPILIYRVGQGRGGGGRGRDGFSSVQRSHSHLQREKAKYNDWREKGSSEAATGSRIKNGYLSSVKTGSLRGIYILEGLAVYMCPIRICVCVSACVHVCVHVHGVLWCGVVCVH